MLAKRGRDQERLVDLPDDVFVDARVLRFRVCTALFLLRNCADLHRRMMALNTEARSDDFERAEKQTACEDSTVVDEEAWPSAPKVADGIE